MSNRHLARTIAMQTLYQWDFNEQDSSRIDEFIAHNLQEFAPDFDDKGFTSRLVKNVIESNKDIETKIEEYAPDWPIDQITYTDRNILRIGVYELLFDQTIPAKVAINEAIELAKTFGGASSSKFVNGVLGAMYNTMVETNTLKDIDKKDKAENKEQKKEQENN